MTCVTRSDHVFVVFAPRRCREATKERDASEPSRVKTSTSAMTERRGCFGCGVNITAAGVVPAGFSGVFIGVRDDNLNGDAHFAGERRVDFVGDLAASLTGDLTGDLDGVAGLAKRSVGV